MEGYTGFVKTTKADRDVQQQQQQEPLSGRQPLSKPLNQPEFKLKTQYSSPPEVQHHQEVVQQKTCNSISIPAMLYIKPTKDNLVSVPMCKDLHSEGRQVGALDPTSRVPSDLAVVHSINSPVSLMQDSDTEEEEEDPPRVN
jgi:hypothetical protein